VSNGRKRIVAGLAASALIGSANLIPSSPAHAEPTIQEVKDRVGKLYRQAEIASEEYNDAKLRLTKLRGQLKNLKADQKRQEKTLGGVRTELRDSMLREFEGSGSSPVTQVVTAKDPQAFLAGLTTASTYKTLQSDLLGDYDTEVTRLDIRSKAVTKRVTEVAETTADLKKHKDTVDGKLADANDLLDELEAEERAQLAPRTTTSRDAERAPVSAPAASGSAGAAVSYAMSQVGDAYVYGAAGPDAFDCSGLTMMAWGAAGVSLPHSSSAQMGSGASVSQSALQPGDLVFYYSPVSHVGMYIGNGQIVHAANPGSGVTTAPVNSMPYSGAVRPG